MSTDNHPVSPVSNPAHAADDASRLRELGERLAAVRYRLDGQAPADPNHPAAAGEAYAFLDPLTDDELRSLGARLAHRLLMELDMHLAAGRLLDMDIIEQRAG
jgi:hypothetical protein